VRDARHALDAAHAFLVRGKTHACGENQGGDAGGCKGAEQRQMHQLGQERPDAQKRDDEKQAGDAEDQPQARPQPLEEQREAAQRHLACKRGVEWRS